MAEKYVSICICHFAQADEFGEKSAGGINRSEVMRTCLESLPKTTDYPAEVIVVDNGGNPDDSDYLVQKEREDVINIYLRNKNNMNFAFAWNQAVSLATGSYLAFVCNDIYFEKPWLKACVDILEAYPHEKYIATPFITPDKRRNTIGELPGGVRLNTRAGSNCMVMRREVYEDVGKFLHHRIAGTLWHTRMFRMGYRIVSPPEDLVRDLGFRRGTNFSQPIKVAKRLLNNSEVDFTDLNQ